MCKINKKDRGQSVIEIIVAVAIFTIIAGSSIITILGSFSTSRLAEEELSATQLAIEGVEAVTSIRNQNWGNLIDGTYGISLPTNPPHFWVFSGNFDKFGKYTRTVKIDSVQRDANDNIVDSGGTVDDDTKKITSTVTWNFTSVRPGRVELIAYLTNWQAAEGIPIAPTSTPSPTNTPPVYATCQEYCIGSGYLGGTCLRNAGACATSGYIYSAPGDQYCTGGPSADTCCCMQ